MKKKIYFITSSIIQIILVLTFLLSIDQIIQTTMQVYQEFQSYIPAQYYERMITLLENSGGKMLVTFGLISLCSNISILVLALKNRLLKNKGIVITLSVVGFIVPVNTLCMILALVNFIVILCCKRKNPEDFPDKKPEIPKVEYEKSSIKEKVFSIILVLVYFSQLLVRRFISIDISPEIYLVILGIFYIFILVATIFVFKDKYKKDLKLFKENSKAYFFCVVPRYLIMYIVLIVVSLTCMAITKQSTSTNQSNLESLPGWFVIPSSIIFAPIVEEAIFRGVLRRFIKNKIVFITISGIIFGLLHTLGVEGNILTALVGSLPYVTIGVFLAYIYAKTENICTNTLCHAFNNIFAAFITLFLLFAI